MTKYYKNMELISTIFGGKKLIYDGYIYIKDIDSEDSTYWRCEKRGLCNSRMITQSKRISEKVTTNPQSSTRFSIY